MNRAYISFMVIRGNNNYNNTNNQVKFEWPNMFSTRHKKQIKSYCHAISCNIWRDKITIPKLSRVLTTSGGEGNDFSTYFGWPS